MAGTGISATTARGLASDEDLDKSLYGAASQRLGVEPSSPSQKSFVEKTMTPAERDAEIKRQKAKADAAYREYKQRGNK